MWCPNHSVLTNHSALTTCGVLTTYSVLTKHCVLIQQYIIQPHEALHPHTGRHSCSKAVMFGKTLQIPKERLTILEASDMDNTGLHTRHRLPPWGTISYTKEWNLMHGLMAALPDGQLEIVISKAGLCTPRFITQPRFALAVQCRFNINY